MKINSIGIDVYQRVGTDNAATKRPSSGQSGAAIPPETIEIPGQGKVPGSRLGVQVHGNGFADMLSLDEKKALEILFERFRTAEAGTAGYGKKNPAESSHLGRVVDVKL